MKKATLWAAAVVALCFMVPGLADPYQTPRLLALGLMAFAMLLMPSQHDSRLEQPIIIGLCLWAAAAACTTDRAYTLVGAYLQPFDSLTAVLVYAGLALGASRLGFAAEDAADAICWSSLPLSAYAIFQRFFADPLLPAPLPGIRVVAMQGSPVYLGPVLAIVVACALNRRRWAALALAVPALYFTGTRGAMLGAGLAAAVLMPRRWLPGLCAIAAGVAVLHPRTNTAGSDLGRLEIWRTAWAAFLSRPIVGTGPGTFGEAFRQLVSPAYVVVRGSSLAAADHAHNEVLQVLATTGIVGLAGYLVVAGEAVALATQNRLLLAAGVAYLIPAMLNPAPHAAVALLCLLFGSSAAVARKDAQPRRWVPAAAVAVSVVLCARVAAADWHCARAIRAAGDLQLQAEHLNRAAQLNPWEPKITAAQLEAIERLDSRPEIMNACVGIARDLVARHPLDSSAHEILGLTILRASMVRSGADPEEALLEFDRAQNLAPTFAPLMLRRRALAKALGLRGDYDAANEDLARVRAWEGGDHGA